MKNMLSFIKTIGICLTGILLLMIAQGGASLFYLLDLFGFQYMLQGGIYILCTYLLIKVFVEKVLHKKLSDSYITEF